MSSPPGDQGHAISALLATDLELVVDLVEARAVRALVENFIGCGGRPAYARAFHLMGYGAQGKSQGCTVEDSAGRRYLDCFNSYGNQAFGYSHPELVEAIHATIDSGFLNTCKFFFNDAQLALLAALADLTDKQLPFAFLTNGGAESIDSALKLARAHTGRRKFVTARGCYHGMTIGAMSAECRPEYDSLYGPLLPGFEAIPFNDEAAAARAIGPDTAGVVLEAIQCEAGVRMPSPTYLKRIRELCSQHGALLIMDEIQTGFGRAGTFFAFESFGIVPDLICIGKSFGGGMTAISAVLSRREYWGSLRTAPLSFGSSIAGNPLALAVGLKAIEIASRPSWNEATRQKGALLADALERLRDKYPRIIADIRGIGLIWGIDVRHPGVAGLLCWLLSRQRVMITSSLYAPLTLRIQPPLVITLEELADCLAKLELALEETQCFLARVDLRGPLDTLSALELSIDIDASEAAVFECIRQEGALYRAWPMIANFSVLPSGAIRCEACFDDVVLTWTDRSTVDLEQRSVVQEVTEGDWRKLTRRWTLSPAERPGVTQLHCALEWNAGTEGFEPLLALRLRYSLERDLQAAAQSLKDSMDTTGARASATHQVPLT